jgi:hypothetical protein
MAIIGYLAMATSASRNALKITTAGIKFRMVNHIHFIEIIMVISHFRTARCAISNVQNGTKK